MSTKYEISEDLENKLSIRRRLVLLKYAGLVLLGIAAFAVIYEYVSWMGDARTSNPYIGEMVTEFYVISLYGYGISLTTMGIIFFLIGFTVQTTMVDGSARAIIFETQNRVLHQVKIKSIPFSDIVDVSMNVIPWTRGSSVVVLDKARRIWIIYFSDVLERALEIKTKVQLIVNGI